MTRRVAPPSDVTEWMQTITNPGRSVAAGVVLRCLDVEGFAIPRVIQVLQTPETDETPRVGLTGVSADGARQCRSRLRVDRVVPKHDAGTKAATGILFSMLTCER